MSVQEPGKNGKGEGTTARVLVTTVPFGEIESTPVEMLERAGVSYAMNPLGRRPTEAELAGLLGDVDVLIAGREPITPWVLDRAPRLRFISRATVGLETVDLWAARARGIPVAYTPGANAQAVAELTVGFVFSLLRGIPKADADMRRGVWSRVMGHCLAEVTLGVIGVGRIGKRVVRHLAPFGPRIFANDITPDEAFGREHGLVWAEKERIYREADLITLHIPATPQTVDLIGAAELAAMKPGAMLINAARGVIVDEAALADALRSGHLGGAAVDAFRDEPYRGELTRVGNCLLTAHMGSRTRSSRLQMEIDATENVICFLRGEPAPGLVPETEYAIQRHIVRSRDAGTSG